MQDLISVLIPMYNSEKYIKECLLSLMNQEYKNFEIIVLDDGSIDNSNKIVSDLAKLDNRIKLYRKDNEKSVSITRNKLLDLINGEYSIFVDSDDVVSNKFLSLLYKAIKETNADIACCKFNKSKVKIQKNNKLKNLFVLDRKDALNEMIFTKRGRFVVWNKLVKTEYLKKIKFDDDLNFGEDFVFTFKLLQQDLKVAFIDNDLYYYRIRNDSISHDGFNDKKKLFLTRLIEMEKEEIYKEDQLILSSWIYITSALYLLLIFHVHTGKEYIPRLKEIMKQYYPKYKKYKSVRKLHRFLLGFVRIMFRIY